MSSISGVSQNVAFQAQQVQQSQYKGGTAKAAAAAALQEASETEATTKQEAAKGDQVAIRKLARQHKTHGNGTGQPSAPSQPSAGAPAAPQSGGINVSA